MYISLLINFCVQVYPGFLTMLVRISHGDVIDDIIRSNNKPKVGPTIILSIFKLEHRTKVQDVCNFGEIITVGQHTNGGQ